MALLFSRSKPPLGLLLRAARHLTSLGWPLPLLLDGVAHLCPRVFSRSVKDPSLSVLLEAEAQEAEDRDAELANLAASAAAVLYSQGYRQGR